MQLPNLLEEGRLCCARVSGSEGSGRRKRDEQTRDGHGGERTLPTPPVPSSSTSTTPFALLAPRRSSASIWLLRFFADCRVGSGRRRWR